MAIVDAMTVDVDVRILANEMVNEKFPMTNGK
jgi:hypothetical protein